MVADSVVVVVVVVVVDNVDPMAVEFAGAAFASAVVVAIAVLAVVFAVGMV